MVFIGGLSSVLFVIIPQLPCHDRRGISSLGGMDTRLGGIDIELQRHAGTFEHEIGYLCKRRKRTRSRHPTLEH